MADIAPRKMESSGTMRSYRIVGVNKNGTDKFEDHWEGRMEEYPTHEDHSHKEEPVEQTRNSINPMLDDKVRNPESTGLLRCLFAR